MNWLNIRTEHLRKPEFIGSDPTDRATWLCVFGYCSEQENAGRIVGARQWKCRQWQQTCGVMLKEILNASRLLTWDGDDLLVWNYPVEKEQVVRAKRETAQINGSSGGRPRKPISEPTLVIVEKPISESGREGNSNGKESPQTPTAASPQVSGVKEGKNSSNIPTTDQSKRIATIFHRKLTTAWNQKEIEAYRKIGTLDADDLLALEGYYSSNWPPGKNDNILRHDLVTFFNNITGEIDRSNAWRARQPKGSAPIGVNGETPLVYHAKLGL